MKSYKVVVTGAFNAGKTEFIRTGSDIDIVTTERRISDSELADTKEETTVAMDYGQTRMDDTVFHLYGTPGQARFEFMWGILAKEMDAYIVIVDSTDQGSLMDTKQIIRLFQKQAKVPYIIAANKQDNASVLSPEEIARLMGVTDKVPVVSCVAHDKSAVLAVLQQLRALLA